MFEILVAPKGPEEADAVGESDGAPVDPDTAGCAERDPVQRPTVNRLAQSLPRPACRVEKTPPVSYPIKTNQMHAYELHC